MEERDEREGRGRLSAPRLRRGTPERAGLDAGELRRLVEEVRARTDGARPWAAGAVVVVGRGPVIAVEEAAGWAVRHAGYDGRAGVPVELPPEQRVPMTVDTPFDLASVTKLFTSVVAVQQIERGRWAWTPASARTCRTSRRPHGTASPCASCSPTPPGCVPNSRCTTAPTTRNAWRCCVRNGRSACPARTATPTSTCCCSSTSWNGSPAAPSTSWCATASPGPSA